LEPAVAFGKVLRQLRQEAGLTQEALGFEADLRRTYVSILELGQQQPSLGTILKLAKALNQPGGILIGMVESELASGTKRKR
jgi:transcriptional regulator with XRE-family HTH domain